MGNYLDLYKTRLQILGNNQAETFAEATKQMIQDKFYDNPWYRQVDIDGNLYDVVWKSGQTEEEKKLLFLPDTVVNRGSIVTLNNDKWLIMDSFTDNDIFPRANINRCNTTLKWIDQSGTLQEHPTVLESASRLHTIDQQKYITTQKGLNKIMLQYNTDTSSIIPGQRFILGSSVYEVSDVDDFSQVFDGYGIVELTMEITQRSDKDDFANKVADNSGLYVTIKGEIANTGGGGWL